MVKPFYMRNENEPIIDVELYTDKFWQVFNPTQITNQAIAAVNGLGHKTRDFNKERVDWGRRGPDRWTRRSFFLANCHILSMQNEPLNFKIEERDRLVCEYHDINGKPFLIAMTDGLRYQGHIILAEVPPEYGDGKDTPLLTLPLANTDETINLTRAQLING